MTSSVGGTIYYTTDGENPTEDSDDGTSVKIYGDPGESVVLKICIFDDEGNPGTIATYTYTIMEKAAAPSSSVASGSYFMSGASIELSVTEGAIYYTTDGSDPTTSSNLYKDPITLTDSVVIKAVCVARARPTATSPSSSIRKPARSPLRNSALRAAKSIRAPLSKSPAQRRAHRSITPPPASRRVKITSIP
jgi:hypothetical protein